MPNPSFIFTIVFTVCDVYDKEKWRTILGAAKETSDGNTSFRRGCGCTSNGESGTEEGVKDIISSELDNDSHKQNRPLLIEADDPLFIAYQTGRFFPAQMWKWHAYK